MKSVFCEVLGLGNVKKVSCTTVGQAAEQMGVATGYQATLNGDSVNFDMEVEENDVVIFSKSIKGGI